MSNKERLRFLHIHLGLSILPGTPKVSGELAEIMAHHDYNTVHNLSCRPAGCPKETETSPLKTPGEGNSQMIIRMPHNK